MNGDETKKVLERKFGTPPEKNIVLVFFGHFVICSIILFFIRPPFVQKDDGEANVLLILLGVILISLCIVPTCQLVEEVRSASVGIFTSITKKKC
jgi:hypothetical protein